jgi:DNA-binding NarL/FixJ family response regulator
MRVLIADDHRLILDSVRRALEDDGGFEVVGEAYDGTTVLELVAKTDPELVLLDVRLPGRSGLECLAEIRRRHPDVKVVMLSASTSSDQVEEALRLGASAYVVKSVDPGDLPATLRQAVEGNVHWPAVEADSQARTGSGGGPGLSEREVTILRTLALGYSNDEIAKELWITRQTVKFHLTNIYRKLDVRNRADAVRKAYALGLGGPTPDDPG